MPGLTAGITSAHHTLDQHRSDLSQGLLQGWDAGENPPVGAMVGAVSTSPWPAPPARPRTWPAYAISAIAIVLAAVALFIRPTAPAAPPAPAAPTHSAADTDAAQRTLCESYKLVASDVRTGTAGADKAFARIATTNGAVMLDVAAGDPALDAKSRDAAKSLAMAYATLTAMGNSDVATEQQYQAALGDLAAKDRPLKDMCNA